MKKILVVVHSGYEETELISTLNIFKRNKVNYYLWSIEGLLSVNSSHEAIVKTKTFLPKIENFDGIFIPGGPAIDKLIKYDKLIDLVKKFNKKNKIIAAICAGPLILYKAGLLNDKIYTAYPKIEILKKKNNNEVEVDKNIITGKSFESTIEFAKEIVFRINKY